MPRITKIYTRQGDQGQTRLGGGQQVDKFAPRVAAYGDVDELNSSLGVARTVGLDPELDEVLERIQNELFHLGTDLCFLEKDRAATALPGVSQPHVDRLEQLVDRLTEPVGPLENFILPGGSPGAAQLHVARCVCRRAERSVAAVAAGEAVSPHVLKYLNRLADALFAMARYENHKKGVSDVYWNSRA